MKLSRMKYSWSIVLPFQPQYGPDLSDISVLKLCLTQEFWDAVGSVVSKSCHVVMMSFVDHLLGAVCTVSKLHNSCRYCYHCRCLLLLLLLLLQLLFTYWKKEKTLTMVSLWETEELNWECKCCTSNLQPRLLIKSVALHTVKQVKRRHRSVSARWEP